MNSLAWVQALAGPIATVVAAGAATWITWKFNSRQLEIAKKQVEIADGQKRIAGARLNFDLYHQRYAIFEAARRLLREVVSHDAVESDDVMKFNIDTSDAAFLFGDDMVVYLAAVREKVLHLRVVKIQAKAAEEVEDEEKRLKLIDREHDLMLEVNGLLNGIVERFKPYLKLGSV